MVDNLKFLLSMCSPVGVRKRSSKTKRKGIVSAVKEDVTTRIRSTVEEEGGGRQ